MIGIIKKKLRQAGLRRPGELLTLGRRNLQRRLPGRYPRFGSDELKSTLESIGVRSGATVFLHSSWDEFYNYSGSAVELIRMLLEHVGPTGTLAMPAFPLRIDFNAVFDVRRTPTGAGLIPELFRRMPNTRRSINIQHSVVAAGPNADYLVRDHHRSETAWDSLSPYARLADVDALIVCAGLPRAYAPTAQHCAESLLYHEIPYFRSVFGEPTSYRYRDENGDEGTHSVRQRTGRWRATRTRKYFVSARRHAQISNLQIQALDARFLIERITELGRQGITDYYWPIPFPRLFKADPPSDSPLLHRL